MDRADAGGQLCCGCLRTSIGDHMCAIVFFVAVVVRFRTRLSPTRKRRNFSIQSSIHTGHDDTRDNVR